MLSLKKYVSALLCAALAVSALLLASCKNNKPSGEESTETKLDVSVIGENSVYSTIDLSEYVSLCQYKELTLDISNTNGDREDMEKAIREYVFENSEIKKYPDAPLAYYFEQEKSFYMYLAKGDVDQYNALLAEAGVSEEDFHTLAKKYVTEDLILYAITNAENISVSSTEKQDLFDKYVTTYVNTYGYTEQYVKENMTELIYDSMLYDKTMEFLIENNSFVTKD